MQLVDQFFGVPWQQAEVRCWVVLTLSEVIKLFFVKKEEENNKQLDKPVIFFWKPCMSARVSVASCEAKQKWRWSPPALRA